MRAPRPNRNGQTRALSRHAQRIHPPRFLYLLAVTIVFAVKIIMRTRTRRRPARPAAPPTRRNSHFTDPIRYHDSMRLIEHANSCFELSLNGQRVLLDFAAANSVPSSHYMPLARPALAANSATGGVDSWRAVERNARWLVDGDLRIEMPSVDAIDLGGIDAILVTDVASFLALPFLTEYTAFRGAVLATAATLRFARHVLLELARLHDAVRELPLGSISSGDAGHRCPPPDVAVKLWELVSQSRLPCGRADIERCLARVRGLSYGERVRLDSTGVSDSSSTDGFIGGCLYATPQPSGAAIGACNWCIEGASGERFVYVSASHREGHEVASRSLMEMAQPMRDADVLLIAGVRATPQLPLQPPSRQQSTVVLAPSAAMERACQLACAARTRGGNVLLPCSPWGSTLCLLERLVHVLDASGLGSTPVHLLSPVAAACCAQAGMLLEWVDSARQKRALSRQGGGRAQPDDAFGFSDFVKRGRLVVAASLDELTTPLPAAAIVLATHPSLRLGDAPILLNRWREDPRSLLLLTTPCGNGFIDANGDGGGGGDEALLLAPFAPLRMHVERCYVDARLGASCAVALIGKLCPRRLVLPSASPLPANGDTAPAGSMDDDGSRVGHGAVERLLLTGDAVPVVGASRAWRCPADRLTRAEPLRVPSKRKHHLAFLAHSAAAAVSMRKLGPTAKVARFSGVLHAQSDGPPSLVLDGHAAASSGSVPISAASSRSAGTSTPLRAQTLLVGAPTADKLVVALRQRGVHAAVRRADDGSFTSVELVGGCEEWQGARIELRPAESTLVCRDLDTCSLLQEVVLEALIEI